MFQKNCIIYKNLVQLSEKHFHEKKNPEKVSSIF